MTNIVSASDYFQMNVRLCVCVLLMCWFSLLFFRKHILWGNSVLLSLNRLFIYLFFLLFIFLYFFSSRRWTCWNTHTSVEWVHGIVFLIFSGRWEKATQLILYVRCCFREGSSWKNPSVCCLLNIDFSHRSLRFFPSFCLEIFSEFKVIFTLFFINAFFHGNVDTWLWDNYGLMK